MKAMIKNYTTFILVITIAIFSAVGQISNPLNTNTVISSDYTYNSATPLRTNANNTTITINSPYTLTINADIEVRHNNFRIIVNEGATFIVNGDINFIGFNGSGNNRPTLLIQGVAAIYGGVYGNGIIDTGSNGSIYIQDNPEAWDDIANVLPTDPFPIELIYFKANSIDNRVQLQWSTASEINNDFFTIERSVDGNNWNILAFIQGAGNSNQELHYKYYDENPLDGISYYRLKQTDFDGKYEYFAPVAVNFLNSAGKMEILNVTSNGLGMNIWIRNNDSQATITVSDIYGRLLYTGNAPVSDYAQQLSIDLPRNYSGEIIVMRLQGQQNSDERKIRVR
jgi:hypothetical protein